MEELNSGYENVNTQSSNKMVKRIFFLTIMVVIVLGCFAFSFRYVSDSMTSRENAPEIKIDPDKGIVVYIPTGSTTEKIASILKENGIIKNPFYFKLMSNINGYDGTYKSGAHILSKELSYDQLMIILSSKPEGIRIMIPEGNTINQIAENLLNKKLITDKEKFNKVANTATFNYKFLQELPNRENRLEGYLFPDTYDFGLKVSEEEIIKIMLNNFNDRFKPEYYNKINELNAKYPKLNMTLDKVVILASIIEREARVPEERARIAGVFYNRLTGRNGAPKRLESCATIQYIYSTKETGISEENKNRIMKGIISDAETKIDDPYNTYKYENLPIGPICNPGKASIEAALNPEDTRYNYFVVKKGGNGNHVFSETLAQHQNAVRENATN